MAGRFRSASVARRIARLNNDRSVLAACDNPDPLCQSDRSPTRVSAHTSSNERETELLLQSNEKISSTAPSLPVSLSFASSSVSEKPESSKNNKVGILFQVEESCTSDNCVITKTSSFPFISTTRSSKLRAYKLLEAKV